MVAKTFPFTIFGMKNGAYHFFNKSCQEIVVIKLCVFYGSTCVAQSQHAGKLTNLLLRISDIWNRFVDNSISCYQPEENITIYEKLFPTKSRCRFIQYMPNIPDKFGIKFWLAVDVESKYILNAILYLGKNESRPSTQRLS